MTWTYEPGTDIFRMRRTIPDREQSAQVWSDEELQSFLDDEGDWRRASAAALEAMASDAAYVMQMIKVQDIEMSGDKAAALLLKRAEALRNVAAQEDVEAGDAFDIIEWVNDDFSYREKVVKDSLRYNT